MVFHSIECWYTKPHHYQKKCYHEKPHGERDWRIITVLLSLFLRGIVTNARLSVKLEPSKTPSCVLLASNGLCWGYKEVESITILQEQSV